MINFDEPLFGLLELPMSGERCKFYISMVVINTNSEKLIRYKTGVECFPQIVAWQNEQ